MIREVSLEEISDGKLYGPNDMVRADCQDCRGCSACCKGMGESIVLDPLDLHRLAFGLHAAPRQMLAGPVQLHVVDGIVLPNLAMDGAEEACRFLDENGRCSVHAFRPGICRLFPLGRIYEGDTFRYFVQVHECRNQKRTKVKVRKWIDTPDFAKYERYIACWHGFLKAREKEVLQDPGGERAKRICMEVLERFYLTAYDDSRDFYEQFYERLELYEK